MDERSQIFCDCKPCAQVRVVYLVADAPHYYAGMVSVASDPAGNVARVPFFEIVAVVVFCLGALPLVKTLAVDEHTGLVRQFQKLRRGRIMRGSDRVYAHFEHLFELPFQRGFVERRAETTQIVM